MWSAHDSIYGARALAKTWERKWYPTTDGSGFVLGRELDRIVKNNQKFFLNLVLFLGCTSFT